MTVSGVPGHADSCMGGGGGGGSSGYALGPSSSLTRLHHSNYGATMFPSSEPLPATSSGHLAQDMEELSLSRGTGETPLPHLQQMFCTTPLLPLLSQASMPPPGTASASTTSEYGAGGTVATQQISSAQHSHQSSMDSGVGPSVAGGHSIPSANQTPEHTKVACFDSSESSHRSDGVCFGLTLSRAYTHLWVNAGLISSFESFGSFIRYTITRTSTTTFEALRVRCTRC